MSLDQGSQGQEPSHLGDRLTLVGEGSGSWEAGSPSECPLLPPQPPDSGSRLMEGFGEPGARWRDIAQSHTFQISMVLPSGQDLCLHLLTVTHQPLAVCASLQQPLYPPRRLAVLPCSVPDSKTLPEPSWSSFWGSTCPSIDLFQCHTH